MTVLMTVVFILGYAAIVFEHNLKIDKAAASLVTGVLCWTIFILGGNGNSSCRTSTSIPFG